MKKISQLALNSLLIGLAMILSYIERFIPLQLVIPLPGVKLGLAKTVTLVALYLINKRQCVVILVIRCILGSIIGGSITGLMFSLIGGLFAMGVMIVAQKSKMFSIYGVSVLGAAFHHVGQILVSMVLMKSIYIGSYLPYLLLVGMFTGVFVAAISSRIVKILKSNPKIQNIIERQ